MESPWQPQRATEHTQKGTGGTFNTRLQKLNTREDRDAGSEGLQSRRPHTTGRARAGRQAVLIPVHGKGERGKLWDPQTGSGGLGDSPWSSHVPSAGGSAEVETRRGGGQRRERRFVRTAARRLERLADARQTDSKSEQGPKGQRRTLHVTKSSVRPEDVTHTHASCRTVTTYEAKPGGGEGRNSLEWHTGGSIPRSR